MTTAADIREAVLELPEVERAEIAAFILEGLDVEHHWVDDEEVHRRSAELESGAVQGLSHEEFLKACKRV